MHTALEHNKTKLNWSINQPKWELPGGWRVRPSQLMSFVLGSENKRILNILTPDPNSFRLIPTLDTAINSEEASCEVWTDNKCSPTTGDKINKKPSCR